MEFFVSQGCINCTTINAFKEHIQKHYNNSVTSDSGGWFSVAVTPVPADERSYSTLGSVSA